MYESGVFFMDLFGVCLCDWMGIDDVIFYDCDCIGILLMVFCFSGYNVKGFDLLFLLICVKIWW